MTEKTSSLPGFYRLNREERLEKVKEYAGLTSEEVKSLEKGLPVEQAEKMVENVISTFRLPLGVAVNFLINGREYIVPMATEETSVIAAASNAAKICRSMGGFKAEASRPIMIGQIQVLDADFKESVEKIMLNKDRIIEAVNRKDPKLVSLGGGAVDVEVRDLSSSRMFAVHLLVDVRDAMGANIVNTMCETAAPLIEEFTGGRTLLKIVSNLADRRTVKASVKVGAEALGGFDVVDRIVEAYEFAEVDVYRAATHNKGVMNGITAVALATGNDTRAVEAGVHAYAARDGRYRPVTRWFKDEEGNLCGEIKIPLAVGVVGGATINPTAKTCLRILGVKTSKELAEVMASVGLAQNLAALKALATEGIQRGHMSLHAKNIAMMAGAVGAEIDEVAEAMVKEKNINVNRAKEILEAKRK